MTSSASSLYRTLHGTAPSQALARRVSLSPPAKLTGMGKLQWLEVARGGRVEQWRFDEPQPRLCFGAITDTSRGRSSLWILGGSYRVDARGFRCTRGRGHLERLDLARTAASSAAIVGRYQRTHGSRSPVEALRASLVIPDELVPLGDLYAVTYDADKGDGTYPYRHPFELTARPLLCCDASGSQLFVIGGAYTVTPHGIEDAE